MKLQLLILLFTITSFSAVCQSVIEVIDPVEADVILLQVNKMEEADIVVYKTRKSRESKQWDCMWKFKMWGFSDLSVYIYTDLKDTSKFQDEDFKYRYTGKIFFTENKDERGYKDPNFQIEGLNREPRPSDTIRVVKNDIDTIIPVVIDTVVVQSTPPVDTETVKTYIPEDIIVFKVQVGACHRQIPYAELHKRYPGNKEISMEEHEGWYKYLIGNFSTYSQAKQERNNCGTKDAWVVVYKNNKRVHITEVINLLTYYPLNRMIIKILT